MDWFSIPQEDLANKALAIMSLPTYIEASSLFVIAAPVAEHWSSKTHDIRMWEERGWCRHSPAHLIVAVVRAIVPAYQCLLTVLSLQARTTLQFTVSRAQEDDCY